MISFLLGTGRIGHIEIWIDGTRWLWTDSVFYALKGLFEKKEFQCERSTVSVENDMTFVRMQIEID